MALASSVIIIFSKYTHVPHAGRPGWGLLLLHTLQHGSILYVYGVLREGSKPWKNHDTQETNQQHVTA